jgi:hypothetical protein
MANISVIRLSSLHEIQNNYSDSLASTVGVPLSVPNTSNTEPFERQLSLLDPLSDRVSTILVWRNLTVLTREDKVTEFCQRIKPWKKFVPKRQCLLNNVSGAITGGLWAVMGTSYLSVLFCNHRFFFHFRSIGFR